MAELELLHSYALNESPIAVPNSVINVNQGSSIMSNQVDSTNVEKINEERDRLRVAIKDACNMLFCSVHSKKQRDRPCMLKKF